MFMSRCQLKLHLNPMAQTFARGRHSAPLEPCRIAISMACRLRFCRKLDVGDDGSTMGSPTALAGPTGQLDLDAMLRWLVIERPVGLLCSILIQC